MPKKDVLRERMILDVNSIESTDKTNEISVDSVGSISTPNELVFTHNESSYINSSGISISGEEDSTQTFSEILHLMSVQKIYLV